ncbi:hypothetical protein NLA06_09725 [Desulfomicrobium sp. ZS1]|uniref:hypothetical protein n=1 Tax=Desulfomicrobium sp. ZS1 TaxID=2952228 RepID=UPI0020B1B239|nr:hypothetical protein [Desulfomicrobium sp. ZS1]UTF48861.1 hypothetical protein NLA06_09725 [Desulfomicrobium sp. ZS1]
MDISAVVADSAPDLIHSNLLWMVMAVVREVAFLVPLVTSSTTARVCASTAFVRTWATRLKGLCAASI